jgi:hypothetical protein
VTETCEALNLERSGLLQALLTLLRGGGDRAAQLQRGMDATLAALKTEAESAIPR